MLPAPTNQDVLAAAGSTQDLKVDSEIGGKSLSTPLPAFSRLHLCFEPSKEEAASTALTWLCADGSVLHWGPDRRAPALRDLLIPPCCTQATVPTGQLYCLLTAEVSLPSLHPVPPGHMLPGFPSCMSFTRRGIGAAQAGAACITSGVLHFCPTSLGMGCCGSRCSATYVPCCCSSPWSLPAGNARPARLCLCIALCTPGT